MKKSPLFASRGLLSAVLVGAVLGSAVASDKRGDCKRGNWEHELLSKGYAVNEAGMKEVLDKRDHSALMDCLKFIAQKQYTSLVPDVKAYLASLAKLSADIGTVGQRMMCIECLMSIDKDMTEAERDTLMTRVRTAILENPWDSIPIHAYNALLAAQEHQHVDIADDLRRLSETNTMGVLTDQVILRRFELYGKTMTTDDVRQLMGAWKDNEKVLDVITKEARRGNLLPENAEPAPAAK